MPMIYAKWHSVTYKIHETASIFNLFVPLKCLINKKQGGLEDQNNTHLSSIGPFKKYQNIPRFCCYYKTQNV